MAHPSGGAFCPTLILVGIRLGIDRVTPVYWDALRTVLQMPQSMGIAGGRPSSSHYFVGVQGHNFFYLDPHQTRNALPLHLNPNGYTEKDVSSCHTRRLRRLHVEEMDPSMLLAFLVRDQQDWAAWRQRISSLSGKSVVHIADQDPGPLGHAPERASALDEVEVLDDEDEESHLPKG
ncbi:MAG: Cysteine protease atg4 [Caeruleum heppii]|nr:MAG: Cysteine protease atg4 [Caeruleum heppii]